MTLERARSLRKAATEAERLMWRTLRQFKQVGLHFRRQVPIGAYFADFACHRAKVIVELDGGQHSEDERVSYDAERTRYLEARGYKVMRFWNADVSRDAIAVGDAILAESLARLSAANAPRS